MPAAMADEDRLLFVPVGANPARPFGMEAKDRACRLAANAGFDCADAPQAGGPPWGVGSGYSGAPAGLKAMRPRRAAVLPRDEKRVMPHAPAGRDAAAAAAAVESGSALADYEPLPSETA